MHRRYHFRYDKRILFDTDIGGFKCLLTAENANEIDEFFEVILEITEDKRKRNPDSEKTIQELISLLGKKDGETEELISAVNKIHHIL